MSILSENIDLFIPATADVMMISDTASTKLLPKIFKSLMEVSRIDAKSWTFSTVYKLMNYSIFLSSHQIPDIGRHFEDFNIPEIVNCILNKSLMDTPETDQFRIIFRRNTTFPFPQYGEGYVIGSDTKIYPVFQFNTFKEGISECIITPPPEIDREFIKFCREGHCEVLQEI